MTLAEEPPGPTTSHQIAGLPGWAHSDRYDVQAKMDESTVEALKKLTPKFANRKTSNSRRRRTQNKEINSAGEGPPTFGIEQVFIRLEIEGLAHARCLVTESHFKFLLDG